MTAPTPERDALTEPLSAQQLKDCAEEVPLSVLDAIYATDEARSNPGRRLTLFAKTAQAVANVVRAPLLAEIAELRAEIVQWQERALRDNETLQETYDKLTAENARLAARCEELEEKVEDAHLLLWNSQRQVRSGACGGGGPLSQPRRLNAKEYAERLEAFMDWRDEQDAALGDSGEGE